MTLELLHDLYSKFDPAERDLADQVLCEWVLSEDEKVRFDALSLIADFKITRAGATLNLLAQRLVTSNEPGAPYELRKIERILHGLGQV